MPDRRKLTDALRRTLSAALLLLPAASIAAAQGPAAAPPPASERHGFRPGVITRETPDGPIDAFEFELSGSAYRVRVNGAGRRTKEGGTRLFNLRLDGRDSIRNLYYAEYEGNLLLACEVSDGETGAGFVVRLEQPSMRARWRREVPTPGLGPPARDGASLYLTAMGFVARLDLRTGEYVWRQEGHDAHGARGRGTPEGTKGAEGAGGARGVGGLGPFGPPEPSGDEVLFREVPVYNRAPRTVRVARKTGRIVGIE